MSYRTGREGTRANRIYAALPLLLACGLTACRQDMHDQPRYKPLAASGFFGDGMSARMPVEGTVAWGRSSVQPADPEFLRIDQARYTGKVDSQDIDYFPFPITKEDLDRGQQRFNIYCSPCHSRIGDGNGLVVRRGFPQAASYHTDRLLHAPVGHFFDVMTNGLGKMPSYASRVEPDDRWRIAAYIRVLQFSQNAPLSQVPADKRGDLDKNIPSPTPVETSPPQPQEPKK
ncbi:MAG TPA: cytochrome c [Bryobacteraceae bacterium]|nr:cytochrome c [Bryobacteraceae bacterium]